MAIKILDVGQCGFDGPRMAKLWKEKLGATVHRCDDAVDAMEQVQNGKYDVVLVNRVLAADGSSGLELIESLLDANTTAPVILVSDHPEAQDAAVALGAVRGFGKADLDDEQTLELVKQAATGRQGRSR